MLFDTHCHYNLTPLKENWKTHWKKAQDHGVGASVVVGTDTESSTIAVAISQQEPNLFAAVGQHPGTYHALVKEWLSSSAETGDFDGMVHAEISQLRQLLTEKVVAIGETGLDYYRLPQSGTERSVTIALQQEAFSAHIQLANETGRTLVIHVRDRGETAYWDTLELLKQQPLQVPFILHCISGPSEYVQQALNLGAYIGVAGNATYRSSAQLHALLQLAPANRILLETDAPYLPPEGYRGKTCDPWMIAVTAEHLERAHGIQSQQCSENALEAYGLES